jgi:hypothetical protein
MKNCNKISKRSSKIIKTVENSEDFVVMSYTVTSGSILELVIHTKLIEYSYELQEKFLKLFENTNIKFEIYNFNLYYQSSTEIEEQTSCIQVLMDL